MRARFASVALLAAILGGAGAADAQVNARKMTPAEQAFVDKLAAEFAKILPPVPAGWAEVERRLYDPGGMTSDWDAPIQADYEVQLVVKDLEARQKIVADRDQALTDKNKDAFEAATARNEKMIAEFSAKLEAAMAKKDMALVEKLQADFQKQMEGAMKPPPIAPRPELSDSYARIRVAINPYSAPVEAEKALPAPVGFTAVGRREPHANNSDREGVTRYLIGNWAADALFKAMNITRLKALLQ